jgi:MoaA/NifB/PqqE/SkfB family radical SAM enzyme
MAITVDEALLMPGPIHQVRLDITSRCNLRCVYCAVSHPDYKGIDMANGIAQKAIALVLELAKHNRLDPIDLNGHGETTFREGWTDICFALIERGVRVRITSNFAKSFNEAEFEALASMDEIAISMDSADPKLLRDVRRKVDLRQIVTNVAFVRATALRLHRRPPAFAFLCGLYDKNTLHWESFARFAVALGITSIGLWSLTEHDGLDVPVDDRVHPLDDLPDVELRPRLLSIRRGLDFLRRHDVPVAIQGGFVENLERRVRGDG